VRGITARAGTAQATGSGAGAGGYFLRVGKREDLLTGLALAVAVTAVSSSGPLVVFAAVPPLAVAFWRNALAAGVLWPVTAVRHRDDLAGLGTRGLARSAVAGLALAVHFGTWMSALTLTSVATATALVCTQPAWAGLLAALRGRPLPRLTWLGIAVAVLGAGLATGADLTVSTRAVVGDLLALAGGLAGGVYLTIGEQVRQRTATTTYTAVCYGTCALALLVACLAGGVPLAGYPAVSWLAIVALTAGPQFLGHSLFNVTLRRLSATVVSVVALLEVPGAALLAYLLVEQVPAAVTVPGMAVLVAGVAVAVLGSRPARRAGRAPPTPRAAMTSPTM
jgi:drug/metabolite transporter (DMT)-like permease